MVNNRYLDDKVRDYETAIMLSKAIQHDIGSAVAYTNGKQVFVNTDENLAKLLPAYDEIDMMKWLLWHERMHMELSHHNRFFRYLKELDHKGLKKMRVTQEEVNIIMDVLVHDSLCEMFPELVDIAKENLAQMRNHNSLKYTFKTHTLEEMLDEYRQFKDSQPEDPDQNQSEQNQEGGDGQSDQEGNGQGDDSQDSQDQGDNQNSGNQSDSNPDGNKSEQKEDTSATANAGKQRGADNTPTHGKTSESESEQSSPEMQDEHDNTDWSQLDNFSSHEFIDEYETERIMDSVNKLKNKKLRMATLTTSMRQLATATRQRTYAMPSYMSTRTMILKGRKPTKASLYLVFDCSGSMSDELQLLKDIVAKSIPSAFDCPAEWHSGGFNIDGDITSESVAKMREEKNRLINPKRKYEAFDEPFYKGQFKDMNSVYAASGGYNDGDRVMIMCLEAEQNGYNPVGVTDGGGYPGEDVLATEEGLNALRKLRRTIIVTQHKPFEKQIKRENPHIQVVYVGN